jgi:mono/diheme cytochrome c family protein
VLLVKHVGHVIINLEKRKIRNTLLTFFIFIFFEIESSYSNENGKMLAFAAGCYSCHTSNSNEPFGGGYKIKTKFGVFISPNISKNKLNGIGKWTKEEFLNAVTHGVSPTNKPYYPVFPFNWYSSMKRNDILDIYDYIQSLSEVKNENYSHSIKFPYNIRELLWVWRYLNKKINKDTKINNIATNNRGEYLVNSVAHCGACHSPRTFFSIIKDYKDFSGKRKSSKILNDSAPNISSNIKNGIGSWSKSDIIFFLQTGIKPNGDFAEDSMSRIIEKGTQYFNTEDLEEIAKYLLNNK